MKRVPSLRAEDSVEAAGVAADPAAVVGTAAVAGAVETVVAEAAVVAAGATKSYIASENSRS
jgi:hypothetical protein